MSDQPRKPFLHSYRDRTGKVRTYLRRFGDRVRPLKAPLGTPEFEAEYAAAMASPIEVAVKIRWPEREELRRTPGDAVYFIRCGRFIKIGRSRDASNRVRLLRSSSPHRLRLLVTIEGGGKVEREMHQKFAHLRHRGEWFRSAPELLRFIETKRKEKERRITARKLAKSDSQPVVNVV